jgi:tetratricopeptide (TPR) repeat protein
MENPMKKLPLLLILCLFTACVSKPKVVEAYTEKDQNDQGSFDRGVQALDGERFEDAARIFDSLLLEKPGTELDLVTLFNSGVAYEGLAQCQKASDRYRKVVRSSAGRFKRIEAEALFRLSLTYECLGQDTKAITALLDAKRRGKDLSFETQQAEIPARLAAAYSRLGNRTKALDYFNQASAGLKAVVTRSGGSAAKVQTDMLARTLYTMGRLSPTQRTAQVNPDTYLQSISMQQPYLLQAMEFNSVPWSAKAEEDLKLAYRNIWEFKIDDPAKRRTFYTRGLQTINELRKIRMNKPDPFVDAVFDYLTQTESRLQNELAKGGATNKLTDAAAQREGVRQQGRLVDPKKKKQTKQQ